MLKADCLVVVDNETEQEYTLAPDWLTAFAGHLESKGCSALTIKAYLSDVRAFAVWFTEENRQALTPDLITSTDLRAYRRWALENKVAPATFNRRRATLSRLIEWAQAEGFLTYNPLAEVSNLPQADKAPRWLVANEIHRLLRQVELHVNGAVTGPARVQALRDQAVVAMMLYAGLREGEVSQLDAGDVTISERKGRVIVRRGKGDKRREVPLCSEARRALRLYLDASQITDGPLFRGKGGARLGVKGIQDRVFALRQAAGLEEHVTPHALRHTFAKRILNGGGQLTEVKQLLGHERLETTARYVMPGWDDLEDAVEKF
jgi:site-specific recombinase XerD